MPLQWYASACEGCSYHCRGIPCGCPGGGKGGRWKLPPKDVEPIILCYCVVVRNEAYLAVIPLATCMRRPQEPDDNELSVTVTCQLAGSVVPVCQTLAYKVVPTTRKQIGRASCRERV